MSIVSLKAQKNTNCIGLAVPGFLSLSLVTFAFIGNFLLCFGCLLDSSFISSLVKCLFNTIGLKPGRTHFSRGKIVAKNDYPKRGSDCTQTVQMGRDCSHEAWGIQWFGVKMQHFMRNFWIFSHSNNSTFLDVAQLRPFLLLTSLSTPHRKRSICSLAFATFDCLGWEAAEDTEDTEDTMSPGATLGHPNGIKCFHEVFVNLQLHHLRFARFENMKSNFNKKNLKNLPSPLFNLFI